MGFLQRIAIVLLLFVCSSFNLLAQGGEREKFTEANLLTLDGIYGLAIPLWTELLESDPGNANFNYKLGLCYLNMGIDKDRALPYLQKASKSILKNYDPFIFSMKGAPQDVYYHLARGYHLNNQIDSAEHFYQLFLDNSSKKHFLRPDSEMGLLMCANARSLMNKPLNVKISNIGEGINSSYSDYAPIVSLDENTLYFTSRRLRDDGTNEYYLEGRTGMYYEDMYVSYRDFTGAWKNPELLSINEKDQHSSVVSMDPSGQRIYIYKTYNGNGNLYQSDFVEGQGWDSPELIGSDVNTEANEFFAMATADGQRLYFVSDRKGGMGGKDIWYVQKLPTGDWGKAINAGAPINTPGDEDAPFLHPDGKTMYFSSNGDKSMGGYDIFYTQMKTDGSWEVPKNIGYPINTTDDDVCFLTTPKGDRSYYSSRSGSSLGSSDIYVVDYIEKNEQLPEVDLTSFAVLKGWVLTAVGTELPADLRIDLTDNKTNESAGTAKPVARNGSFVFIIPSGQNYDISYNIADQKKFSEVIEIPVGTEYVEFERELFLFQQGSEWKMINLNENLVGDVIRWKLSPKDNPDKLLPLGTMVYFYNEDSTLYDSTYVNSEGFFEYKKLAGDAMHIMRPELAGDVDLELVFTLINEDGSENPLRMARKSDGKFYEVREVIADVVAMTETDDTESNSTPESGKEVSAPKLIDQGPKPTPKPSPKSTPKATPSVPTAGSRSFYLFFDYNQIDMEEEDPTFAAAMAAMRDMINAGKTPVVSIEASASNVPTSLFPTNEGLAEERLNRMKAAIATEASSFAFDAKSLNLKDLHFHVQGPPFKESNQQPKAKYLEYQYVRISIN